MHIGLIGGIGPAATDYYYRLIIDAFKASNLDLDLTIAHADVDTLIANQLADDQEKQSAIFARLSENLARAGADIMAVTSIAGHFCIDHFIPEAALPVNNLLESLQSYLNQSGYKRFAILGTKTAMQSGLYGTLDSFELVTPDNDDVNLIHQRYVDMAAAGTATQDTKDFFVEMGRKLVGDLKADAVLLGGTDLALVYETVGVTYPVIDCAKIHALDIARMAGVP